MNDLLFHNLPEQYAPTYPRYQSTNRCGNCKHIQKWARGGSYVFYCGTVKDSRTENKLLKVKCKKSSCDFFEKRQDARSV